MNKKAVRLVAVGAALIVVFGGLLLVQKLTRKPEEKKQPKMVSQAAVKDIEGITYSSESTGGEEVSLVRENNIWYYEKDKDFPIDQEYVTNSMVLAAAQATADKTVEQPGEDLSQYGLDDPSVRITLKKITGDEVKMSIGSYNQSVEGYYLKVEGDDSLYLVDGKLVFAFDMSIYEIADKEDFPLVEKSSFVHLLVQKGDAITEFKGEVRANAEKYMTDNYYFEEVKTWSVVKNGGAYKEGNQEAVMALLDTLTSLDYSRMIEYHADEQTLAGYGLRIDEAVRLLVDYQVLDETTAREVKGEDGINEIVCDTLDKQYILLIGNRVPDNAISEPEYYVSMQGSDVVYTMREELLADIVNLKAEDYQ